MIAPHLEESSDKGLLGTSPIGVDLGELRKFIPVSAQIKRRIGIISGPDVGIGKAQEFLKLIQSWMWFDFIMENKIKVVGAKVHNLKNITVEIPRDKFVVITGLSGSGKSSLAFDTIFAEGQRRYVESLSAYARQFLSLMEKPDVDHIEGLSPTISIEQKSTSHNPRSTVGTITEVYDYLRLLFARVGQPRCPEHNIALEAQTVTQMVDNVMQLPEGTRVMLLAPVVRGRKGEYMQLIDELRSQGFVCARIDGKTIELDTVPKLDLQKIDLDRMGVIVGSGIG